MDVAWDSWEIDYWGRESADDVVHGVAWGVGRAIGGDDGAIQASGAAALTPQATESSLSRKPFPFGRVLMLSSFAAAAVLLIVSSFQGGSE